MPDGAAKLCDNGAAELCDNGAKSLDCGAQTIYKLTPCNTTPFCPPCTSGDTYVMAVQATVSDVVPCPGRPQTLACFNGAMSLPRISGGDICAFRYNFADGSYWAAWWDDAIKAWSFIITDENSPYFYFENYTGGVEASCFSSPITMLNTATCAASGCGQGGAVQLVPVLATINPRCLPTTSAIYTDTDLSAYVAGGAHAGDSIDVEGLCFSVAVSTDDHPSDGEVTVVGHYGDCQSCCEHTP